MNTDRLILNLEDLTKHYRLLLELVRKEKQILIEAKADQIDEINFQKEILISKINELNHFRIDHVLELASALNIPAGEARLLNLSRHIGGAQGDKLRSQHAALELIIKRLSEINKENAFYAESALKNVASALDSLKETFMGQKTYQNKGKYQQTGEKSGHLVSKEA
jgi:hypothetical protein